MKPLISLLSVIVMLLLQTGCKSLPDKPPIPQEKMKKILLDLQIAETYSLGLGDSVKNKFEKNYDSLSIFYTSILKHYDVSYEAFEEAMDWYKAHPIIIDSLFNGVINQIAETKTKERIKEVVAPDDAAPAVVQPKDSLNKKKDSTASAKGSKFKKAIKDSIPAKKETPIKREF